MSQSVISKEQAHEQAVKVHSEIVETLKTGAALALALADLVRSAKDRKVGGTPFYQLLGFETWPEYCSTRRREGGLGISTRHADRLAGRADYYLHQHQIPAETLADITGSRLDDIRQLKDPDGEAIIKSKDDLEEWLGKAENLPDGDWISEVREATGKPDPGPTVRDKNVQEPAVEPTPMNLEESEKHAVGGALWWSLVSEMPCIFHPDRPAEHAHVPFHKGIGGTKNPVVEFGAIPLCSECHRIGDDAIHKIGMRPWVGTYYPKVMDLLWRSLFTALAERAALEAELKAE